MSPTQPAAVPTMRMTVDEYWEFVHRPENADRLFELRKGEVIEMSRPKKPHGIVCSRINYLLTRYAEERGSGYVECNDTGVVLEEEIGTVVGPDVAFFTDAASFDEIAPEWSYTPPLLAVEVRSPSDRPGEVNEKVQDYLSGGVRVVWVVNTEERNVTVYRPDGKNAELSESATLSGEPELPGFECPVAALFRLPGQKPTT